MSLRTRHYLRRFMPREYALRLTFLYDDFKHAIDLRDWARVDSTIREISSLMRRIPVSTPVIDVYLRDLENVLNNRRAVGVLPAALYEDIHHLLMREISVRRLPKETVEEKKEAEKTRTKIERINRIEVGADWPVLFFLGAGASKPPPSNIPTVNELLSELWKKSNQMENKPLAKLEAWCRENQIDNIEEMLTGVTLADFMIRNRKVHNLLNSVLYPEWGSLKELSIRDVESVSSFQNMLNTFFSLLVGTMLNAQPNPIHEALTHFINIVGNASIVTTNYDVCMDQALDKAGIKYSYIIGAQKDQHSIPLVKMHGSINWFYCETCQHVLRPTIENMRRAIENDLPYSVTGMCPICNASTRQFIVPPTTYKYLIYPPIVQVWNAGRDIFEISKIYVIIGYSFSVADDYISKMLLKAIREDPSKQLIIIDKSVETLERFKSYVKTHAMSFEEKNIHDLAGSAEDVVPDVVRALLKEKKTGKRGKKMKTSS